MSTVVFFNVPAQGHTNPTLPLVAELVRRGERVIYYSMPEFEAKISASGAEFRPYRIAMNYDLAQDTANLLGLAALLMTAAEQLLPSLLDDLRALQPDYVIHDSLAVWGKYAAHALDLPVIDSISTFAFVGNGLAAALDGARMLLLRTFLQGLPQGLRAARLRQGLRRRYGLAWPLTDVFSNTEAFNLVYTSREFQPGGDRFGDDFAFVGPCLAPRPDDSDFRFEALGDAPLIYISLGTVRNRRADFYRACLDALGDGPYAVVMSIGTETPLDALGPIPAHVIVRPRVPQLAVLERASLFITHAGMNSIHEGLYYGVPLIAVPQQPEQTAVAARVVAVGAGIHLPDAQANAATLRAAVERVLADPGYAARSRALGDTLRAAGGCPRAADEVFAFKARLGLG